MSYTRASIKATFTFTYSPRSFSLLTPRRRKSSSFYKSATLLHHLYEHLDRQKSYARVLFMDFSSAFNTIQPHLMVKKLLSMSVNPALIKWLFSFLTDRTQRVRVGKAISSARTTNTGAPQGCVLSPALFTLCTADCRRNPDANLLIKFADDTSLTGLVEQDEAAYRGGVQQLVEWCDSNFLALNVSKTKELVVDFRVAPTDTETEPINIKGQSVEMVSAYKYLGVVICNKLSWNPPPPSPPTLTRATRKHKRRCICYGS